MRRIKTETALKAIKALSFGTLQHVTDLLGTMTRPGKRIFTVSVEDVVDGYNQPAKRMRFSNDEVGETSMEVFRQEVELVWLVLGCGELRLGYG